MWNRKTRVKMKNGAVIFFRNNTKIQRNTTINHDGVISCVTHFTSGETLSFVMPPDMLHMFAAHGLEARLSYDVRSCEEPKEAYASNKKLIALFKASKWEAPKVIKATASKFGYKLSVLGKAMVLVYGQTGDEVWKYLRTLTRKQKMALRKNPLLMPTIDHLDHLEIRQAKKDTYDAIHNLSDIK